MIEIMTSKRNSRVFAEEIYEVNPRGSSRSSPHVSRRSSNGSGSSREDFLQAVQEAEEGKRTQSIACISRDSSNTSIAKSAEVEVKSLSSPIEGSFPPVDIRPSNFGVVFPGVYRSSYPTSDQFSFLKGLGLKTVVTLVKKDELDQDLTNFVTANNINQIIFNMKGTKKEAILPATMNAILRVMLNRANYPILIHCNHGKHRTGCVIAAMRKTAGWDGQRVIDEYRAYAEPKVRECDVDYISNFEAESLCMGDVGTAVVRYSARFTAGQMRKFWRAMMLSTVFVIFWLFARTCFLPPTHTRMPA